MEIPGAGAYQRPRVELGVLQVEKSSAGYWQIFQRRSFGIGFSTVVPLRFLWQYGDGVEGARGNGTRLHDTWKERHKGIRQQGYDANEYSVEHCIRLFSRIDKQDSVV